MATNAKTQAREQQETRQKKVTKGNKPEQRTHDETEERISAHDENTERDIDELYDTEGDNEILEWRRHSDLDAPPSRDGYVNRFIRIRLGTVRDTARLRNAIREGWRPVKASTAADDTLPTIHLDQYGDVIGVEDLILCEMPDRTFRQRQLFYKKKLARMNAAIDRQLRKVSADNTGSSGFGNIQQSRHSSVSVPQRRQNVAVADDE